MERHRVTNCLRIKINIYLWMIVMTMILFIFQREVRTYTVIPHNTLREIQLKYINIRVFYKFHNQLRSHSMYPVI